MVKQTKTFKPTKCPFCGGRSELYRSCVGRYRVYCKRCGCTTKDFEDRVRAIETWNRRII